MAEITIRDIAKKCGVGVSTVSRALNDHPDINRETKERIRQVMQELGYIPNNSARNLKRIEANSVALLVKGIANPFFSGMIKVIEEQMQKRKYSLVLHHVEDEENEVEVALELVKEKRLRGIIFLGGSFIHAKEQLEKLKVPFIFSTVSAAPVEQLQRTTYSNIAVDDVRESERMVTYLLEQGHRDIAILTTDTEKKSIGKQRLLGYCNALEKCGIAVRRELIRYVQPDIDHYSMENGYQTMKRLIAEGEKFSAVFAISDELAVGAMRALRDAGIDVPGQVSVAGFDGLALGEYIFPSLTTIRQPVEEMALETAKLLFKIIEGEAEHKHIDFQAELLVRESTAAYKAP